LRFWILAFFCARSAFCFVMLRSMVVVLVKGAPSAPSSCIASVSADRAPVRASSQLDVPSCSVLPFKCSCVCVYDLERKLLMFQTKECRCGTRGASLPLRQSPGCHSRHRGGGRRAVPGPWRAGQLYQGWDLPGYCCLWEGLKVG